MKNNIQVCLLVIFIVIAGIKCKPNKYELQGENGFKVILEETNNVPEKFHPDSLSNHRAIRDNNDKSWEDIVDSARLRYFKYFTKHDGVTTIKIKNNKTVQLVDKTSYDLFNVDDLIEYNYMCFIPEIDSHLVNLRFYEAEGYTLVSNKTGEEKTIWWIPYISPDKNRFAIAKKDFFYDAINIIQIFEIVSDKYIEKFEHEFDWGPDNVRWLDNDTFIVDKYILEIDKGEKKTGYVIFKLVDGK
jgi:hypothetical protein